MLGAARIEVAANREHDHQPLVGVAGALDQRVEERLPLGPVATGDEGLLELVDQEHQALAGLEPVERVGDPRRGVLAPRLGHRPGEGPRELGQRPLAGAHHRPPPVLGAGDDPVGERRQEAGAHSRGLAAARGADHREQRRADQAGDELCDQALAAEEVLGVGGVERRQAAEGAHRGCETIRGLLGRIALNSFRGGLQVDHVAGETRLRGAQAPSARRPPVVLMRQDGPPPPPGPTRRPPGGCEAGRRRSTRPASPAASGHPRRVGRARRSPPRPDP